MVSFKSLFVVLAVSTCSIASPLSGGSARRDEVFKGGVVESLSGPPLGWAEDENVKLDKDELKISLRIHLVQQDMDKFHDLAMKV
jgi:tripeptidyl-peptidase-1